MLSHWNHHISPSKGSLLKDSSLIKCVCNCWDYGWAISILLQVKVRIKGRKWEKISENEHIQQHVFRFCHTINHLIIIQRKFNTLTYAPYKIFLIKLTPHQKALTAKLYCMSRNRARCATLLKYFLANLHCSQVQGFKE